MKKVTIKRGNFEKTFDSKEHLEAELKLAKVIMEKKSFFREKQEDGQEVIDFLENNNFEIEEFLIKGSYITIKFYKLPPDER